jgi:hypothetical protein
VAEIVEAQDAFLRVGVGGEHMAAMDAGEQAAGDGRGEQAAVFLDEDVVDGGFSDFAAVIQEQHIVVAGCASGLEGLRVDGAMGGLVEVHGVGGVGALGGDADAEGWRFGSGMGSEVIWREPSEWRRRRTLRESGSGVPPEEREDGAQVLFLRGLEGGLDLGAVEGEGEVAGGVFEAVEVELEEWIAAAPEHGFD